MTEFAALSLNQLMFAGTVVFLAGIVRGFTGFALSALIMSTLVMILPTVELLPVCLLLEFCASLILMRGGIADADRIMVFGLQAGAIIGLPAGLYLTTSLPAETTRLIALSLILGLAALQLARVRLPASGSFRAAAATGALAGVATGLASVGGMVIALYTLARQMPARTVRASLILSILVGGAFTLIFQVGFGIMTITALSRALILIPPLAIGVLLGRALFTPAYERYYRPICLTLLMGLATLGICRTVS